jgi:hypothetical protein
MAQTASCPIACPCRRGPEGIFVLAGCVFVARHGGVFLGDDFGTLANTALRAPHDVPFALAAWSAFAIAGCVLIVIGLRMLLLEGESAPARPAMAMVLGCLVAMGRGWYLPRGWGEAWWLASEGIYLSLIAAGLGNVGFALAARVWAAGFVAAVRRQPFQLSPAHAGVNPFAAAPPTFDQQELQQVIDGQAEKISELIEDRRLAVEYALDLENVFAWPGVERAVKGALHPDRGATDGEKRVLTERFQKAAAVFDRLKKGR